MPEARLSWNQPMCESCWVEREAVWNGDVFVSVRMPARVRNPGVEQCAWCGEVTIFGVFKRADPTTVPYPHLEEVES